MGQRAVNALLKARALNPQADRVWIALVQLLVDVGQPDKARPLIPAARAALKGEQAPITLATCCELINDMGKAQAQLRGSRQGLAAKQPRFAAGGGFLPAEGQARPGRTVSQADHCAWKRRQRSPTSVGPAAPWPTSSVSRGDFDTSLSRHGLDRREPSQQGPFDRRQAREGAFPPRRPPKGKNRRSHPGHGGPGERHGRHAGRLFQPGQAVLEERRLEQLRTAHA